MGSLFVLLFFPSLIIKLKDLLLVNKGDSSIVNTIWTIFLYFNKLFYLLFRKIRFFTDTKSPILESKCCLYNDIEPRQENLKQTIKIKTTVRQSKSRALSNIGK